MRLRTAFVSVALVLAVGAPLSSQELIPPERQTFAFARSLALPSPLAHRGAGSETGFTRAHAAPLELIPRHTSPERDFLRLPALDLNISRSAGCASFGLPQPLQPKKGSDSCERETLSPGGKFVLAMKKTFYPLPLLWSAAGAGISQARNSDPGFGQGAKGYGRRFGDRVGTRGIKEISGTFLIASAFRMDPQYHPSSRRGFGSRLGSVLSQVFVSRTDSGRRTFNFPSVMGAAIGVGVSNTWLAKGDRKASDSAIRFGLSFAFDAASNFFSEFFLCRDHPRN